MMSYVYKHPYPKELFPSHGVTLEHEKGRTGALMGQMMYPWFVDARVGDIVISERDGHRIQILDVQGNRTRFNPFGSPGSGKNQLMNPGGVVQTAVQGANIIIADSGNRRLVYATVVPDQHGYANLEQLKMVGKKEFDQPTGLFHDTGRDQLLVTDIGLNPRVTIHGMDGLMKGVLMPSPSCPFMRPMDVTCDRSSRIFVSDAKTHVVNVFDVNGTFLFNFGGFGSAEGQFNTPWGLCFDRLGNLLVSDEQNNRVQMFNSDCQFIQCISNDVYLPKGLSINLHGEVVVATADPYNFLKFFRYT